VAHEGPAARVDFVEELEEAMAGVFRHRPAHRLPDEVALADDAPEGVVDQGEDVVRPRRTAM
jgi:hypothetical protein